MCVSCHMSRKTITASIDYHVVYKRCIVKVLSLGGKKPKDILQLV